MNSLLKLSYFIAVVDYTKKYLVIDAAQALIGYLAILPEFLFAVNIVLFCLYNIIYSKHSFYRLYIVNIWWELCAVYLVSAFIRQSCFGSSFSYFDLKVYPIKLFIILFFCLTLEVFHNYSSAKNICAFLCMLPPAILILGSKDLLVTAFLIEILFIFTILWSLFDTSKASATGTIRYFIINSVGGGLLLFAVNNYYLITSSSSYVATVAYTEKLGALCFIWSFLIKIASAPFHYWGLDVVNSFSNRLLLIYIQIISKLILFLVYYRFFVEVLFYARSLWGSILVGSSVLSTVIGVLSNPYQYRIKEFLTLSSLVHLSLIQISLAIGCSLTNKLALLYMLVYSGVSLAVWSSVLVEATDLNYFSTLINNRDGYFYSVLFLVVAGFPPSPLFFLKLFIFISLYLSGLKVLVFFLVVLNTLNYLNYLRIIKVISN